MDTKYNTIKDAYISAGITEDVYDFCDKVQKRQNKKKKNCHIGQKQNVIVLFAAKTLKRKKCLLAAEE